MEHPLTPLLRYAALVDGLTAFDGAVVAYSGGVDSTLVARAAHDALGDRMIAILATSPLLPQVERDAAESVARDQGFGLLVIEHPGYQEPMLRENGADRCGACKHALAERLRAVADERGFEAVLHGENADDARRTDRPGAAAAAALGVVSPLVDARLAKADVRAIARAIGLPNADKPSTPCLATRVRTGRPIAEGLLKRIELAEDLLGRSFGFRVLRVRVDGATARVEVGEDEVPRALENALEIERVLLGLGFRAAHIDPHGYRTASRPLS